MKNIRPEKEGYDERVHYCDKCGKEKWNKKIFWDERVQPYLSPNGKTVLAILSDGNKVFLDQKGKKYKLPNKFNWGNALFSPDSSYFAMGYW